MPACSTASLGALSLAALGQGGDYGPGFCSFYRGLSQREQERYPVDAFLACGRGTAWQENGGAAPAPNGNGGNGGTGLEDVLVALFGAVPGTITAIRGPGAAPPPAYAPAQARRAGMGMLGLVAIGVVVWMFAAQGRRD